MGPLLVDLTLIIAILNLAVAAGLVIRRLRVSHRQERLEVAEERLRPMVLAVVDGEEPEFPYLGEDETVSLAQLLRRYARLLTGSSRAHIATAAEVSGLVAREVDALSDRRAWRRAQAAMVLGDLGSATHVPFLIGALNDRSAEVRTAAARSLGRLGAVEAIPRITRQMALGRIPRALTAEALITIGPSAAEWLVRLLRADHAEVRAAAAELLGFVGDARHAGVLARLLSDPDPEVRVKAARSLGRVGAEDAVLELRGALDDPVPFVRAAAARTLASVGDDGMIERMLEMALHDSHDAARAAAEALAELVPEQVEGWVAQQDPAPPHLAEALDLARVR